MKHTLTFYYYLCLMLQAQKLCTIVFPWGKFSYLQLPMELVTPGNQLLQAPSKYLSFMKTSMIRVYKIKTIHWVFKLLLNINVMIKHWFSTNSIIRSISPKQLMDMKSSHSRIRFAFQKGKQSYIGTIWHYNIQVYSKPIEQYVHIWYGQDLAWSWKAHQNCHQCQNWKIPVRNTDT
jgi:hypothetical protein